MELCRMKYWLLTIRWSLMIIVSGVLSETAAFQCFSCQHQIRTSHSGRCRQKLYQIQDGHVYEASSPPLAKFANVGDGKGDYDDGTDPIRENQIIVFDSPSSVSRRSAVTSLGTTAASILFSISSALPAIAAEEEGDTTTKTIFVENIETTAADATVDASADDPPVAKEKTILYSVQDFSVALPVNWKVITKYDEKATKPPSTPTLFSVIDFNTGAVLSIVKEEACSVSEFAKSSFEKSKKKGKNRCDFALRKTSEDGTPQLLFSPETFENDASKLLVRHDDRDNAVLGGTSSIEESSLTVKGGRRRRGSSPFEQAMSSDDDVVSIDSYSSSLLELRAKTTIPTSGTYTDTMGREQPNTIERKVLAKAVSITTRITRTTGSPAESVSSPPATESQLLANESDTSERDGAVDSNPGKDKSTSTQEFAMIDSDVDASTTTDPSNSGTAEATTAMASAEKVSEEDMDVGAHTNESPTSTLTAETERAADSFSSSDEPIVSTEVATTSPELTPAPEVRETAADDSNLDTGFSTSPHTPIKSADSENALTASSLSTIETKTDATGTDQSQKMEETSALGSSEALNEAPADSNVRESAPDSPKAAMMAMVATVIDDQSSPDSESNPIQDIVESVVSETPTPSALDSLLERAQERAVETAIEAVKERAIEQVVSTVKETAKETAKEVVQELLTETLNEPTEPETNGVNNSAEEGTGAAAAASVATVDDASSMSVKVPIEETPPPPPPPSPPDTSLFASTAATPATASEPLAGSATTTTTATTTSTTTTVLSIWLSAPLDEWQKPVMGTKLNQIWESVDYADNIVEGGESLAFLSTDGDDESSINTQLLLLNNKPFR